MISSSGLIFQMLNKLFCLPDLSRLFLSFPLIPEYSFQLQIQEISIESTPFMPPFSIKQFLLSRLLPLFIKKPHDSLILNYCSRSRFRVPFLSIKPICFHVVSSCLSPPIGNYFHLSSKSSNLRCSLSHACNLLFICFSLSLLLLIEIDLDTPSFRVQICFEWMRLDECST